MGVGLSGRACERGGRAADGRAHRRARGVGIGVQAWGNAALAGPARWSTRVPLSAKCGQKRAGAGLGSASGTRARVSATRVPRCAKCVLRRAGAGPRGTSATGALVGRARRVALSVGKGAQARGKAG